MTENELLNAVSELKGYGGSRKAKYTRNYRRYNYTPYMGLDSIRNPSVVGYWQDDYSLEDDTTGTPQLNVIKSCIDTLTSKIAQSKVRPFFNCVNGTFKDIQIVKQAQQFFDQWFEMQNVNKKVSEAFRDACIFETGIVYANPITKEIERALPWQVYWRPSEMTYGKLTRIYYERKDFPVVMLPKELREKVWKQNKSLEFCIYGTYYDTVHEVVVDYVDVLGWQKEIKWEADTIPFVFLHYCTPIFGSSAQSVVDMLNTLQIEIDTIMAKIKDASQLNPALTYFLPEGSSVKASQLSNRVGNIITYRPTPNMTSSPVTVATPAFIDPQYMQTIEMLKENAYQLVGISQLSAQSKKPAGLNSGVALQTMEDVESERFETQLNQVIRCYVDLAITCIRTFDKTEEILPESKNRVSIKWSDIVDEMDRMSIQFSGADALSKDPATKLQQLQLLAQSGVIPQSRIAQFLEIPDINSGYSLSNNAINAVLSVIDDCIENDSMEIPDYIPFVMLKEEIINTQLSLRASNYKKNKDDIDKLNRLFEIAEAKEKEWQATIPTQTEEGQPTNVLEQEAGMTQAELAQSPAPAPQNPQGLENMDMSTATGQGWDRTSQK